GTAGSRALSASHPPGHNGYSIDKYLRRMNTVKKFGRKIHWRLDLPFPELERCEHGETFFKAVGEEFDALHRRDEIINADVLDAVLDRRDVHRLR
ncbi:MAG: hypothetical protein JXB10_10830, partial [Pirellulales bacterium]|nr:hypothetical protein [Pirellulales bacterium]